LSDRPGFPRITDGGDRRAADQHLAGRALRGDSSAKDALAERWRGVPQFLRWQNRRLGAPLSEHELEDAIQDCLVDLWRKLPRYDGTCSLSTWARGFACKQMLRSLHGRPDRSRPTLVEEHVALEDDPGLDRLEAEEAVLHALSRLEDQDADIVQRKHLESMTFEEISLHFDMPLSSVKSRYYRALDRLRRSLGALGTERRP